VGSNPRSRNHLVPTPTLCLISERLDQERYCRDPCVIDEQETKLLYNPESGGGGNRLSGGDGKHEIADIEKIAAWKSWNVQVPD
jgi:hypothetical protein